MAAVISRGGTHRACLSFVWVKRKELGTGQGLANPLRRGGARLGSRVNGSMRAIRTPFDPSFGVTMGERFYRLLTTARCEFGNQAQAGALRC